LWARVYDLAETAENDQPEQQMKRSTRSSRRRRSGPGNATHSIQERLLHFEEAVMQEFTGPFPVAKIDPFEVYLTYK
jgi:hypothetical protein